ncbi:methyltransferase [Phyllobacterium phragmitis]|uniref:Putative 4-hydroxy-4-methyl-2-oxoglutarate aldolase n=1 Tax=Phyllobacterium phragmitis TaxID=2670329 RepID=A0A2S9ISR5_9HYPH|nr:RraA family protein [Phyllobacterium phragmitis]PRD43564.1 methyltransferase [Phyllobacterium phragmitis]
MMSTVAAHDDPKALLEGFRTAATAVISDNLERLPGAVGLRPFHRISGTMVGRAFTVKVAAGDNLFIHKVLDVAQAGDVIVVDGGGETSRALIGEIMVALAKSRKFAGFVIDGAIRDSGAIGDDVFPVFARAAIHRGPYKHGPGAIGQSVSVGGMVVNPGDIVVGDADGVVSFPVAGADELLRAVRAHERKEEEMLRQIAEGTYVGAYAKA